MDTLGSFGILSVAAATTGFDQSYRHRSQYYWNRIWKLKLGLSEEEMDEAKNNDGESAVALATKELLPLHFHQQPFFSSLKSTSSTVLKE